ncbi:MAG: flagellar hook-length control protein FliK [Pseudomonadota bacterium]
MSTSTPTDSAFHIFSGPSGVLPGGRSGSFAPDVSDDAKKFYQYFQSNMDDSSEAQQISQAMNLSTTSHRQDGLSHATPALNGGIRPLPTDALPSSHFSLAALASQDGLVSLEEVAVSKEKQLFMMPLVDGQVFVDAAQPGGWNPLGGAPFDAHPGSMGTLSVAGGTGGPKVPPANPEVASQYGFNTLTMHGLGASGATTSPGEGIALQYVGLSGSASLSAHGDAGVSGSTLPNALSAPVAPSTGGPRQPSGNLLPLAGWHLPPAAVAGPAQLSGSPLPSGLGPNGFQSLALMPAQGWAGIGRSNTLTGRDALNAVATGASFIDDAALAGELTEDGALPADPFRTAQISAQERTAALQQVANLAPLARTGTPGWDQRLGQRLMWMVDNGLNQAELRLDPPQLGSVSVRISLFDDQAQLLFQASHPAAREALESALPKLRDLFSQNGMTLADADVLDSDGSAEREHNADASADNSHPQLMLSGDKEIAENGRGHVHEPGAPRLGALPIGGGRALIDEFV